MYKLGATGMKWLKGLHLFCVSCWIGGALALVLLRFLKDGVTDGGVLFGMNQAIHFVDMSVVVVLGANGCLLTGLLYGIFTRWGFFKHGWMILKWVVTVSAIVFGTFWLGPWEQEMMHISGRLGIEALSNPEYLRSEYLNFTWGGVQVAVLVATIFISVFKPWKGLRKAK